MSQPPKKINPRSPISFIDQQHIINAAVRVATQQARAAEEAETLAEREGIPLIEARRIMAAATNLSEQEFLDQLKGQFAEVVKDATELLHRKLDLLPPQYLPAAIATLTDRQLALAGRPSNISASVNTKVTIGGQSKEDLMARLKKAQPIEDTPAT